MDSTPSKSQLDLEYLGKKANNSLLSPNKKIDENDFKNKTSGFIIPNETLAESRLQQNKNQNELDQKNIENFYDELAERKSRTYEKLTKMAKYNPFVPIGVLITCGVLFNGIWAMKNNNRAKSQKMMKYRVTAQGSTLVALVFGTLITQYFYQEQGINTISSDNTKNSK